MASTPEKQIAFVQRIAANDKHRAAFVADPVAFAKKNKIELDPGFAKIITANLAKIEKDRLKLAKTMRLAGGAGQPKMNLVAAAAGAAAIVASAMAVSTAVAAVYDATKWKGGFEVRGLVQNSQLRGRVASTRLRNRIR